MLVTGTSIASAKLQLWQSSGICSISPLSASNAEHLGAAWILAARAAVAAQGLEVCPAMAIDRATLSVDWYCICLHLCSLLQAVLYEMEAPPYTHAVVQLGTEPGISLPWVVPFGDMARAGNWGLLCREEPPSPKEASWDSATRLVARTRRAEAESLVRFWQGSEPKVCPEHL